MFAQAHLPETLTPLELDQYLEKGWFRMGQTIFTTNFLHFKNKFYSAIWLRVVLEDFTIDNTQQKLTKRNAKFTTLIQPASVTPEKEELYALYKQSVPFEPSASIDQLLFGKTDRNIYNTYEVNIFDNDKLIAVGYFDLGEKSAEGISSFYHPSYKKYSLGKHLIYLKMNYCKALGLQYFYPGYFVPGYSYFDYKVDIGKPALQYLRLSTQQWIPFHNFSQTDIPIQTMHGKLDELQQHFFNANLKTQVVNYDYFDANLIPDLRNSGLFDFPVFLKWTNDDNIDALVVYDVCDAHYHLITALNVWKPAMPIPVEGVYNAYLLRMNQDLFQTTVAREMFTTLMTH